ncbi:uncharacterized protein BJX67DRAFT_371983 [Aspergillus lucknowensis]|uniref:Transcription initiation factor TFIID subunit 8 n=1 Tax=Aspergillus lucknowensis TaxID=176173 RepID=A0ABR4LS22_9EURO
MELSSPTVKRSFSTYSESAAGSDAKRIKRPYHHHHRLQDPVNLALSEPAIADDSYVDQVMNRTIGQSLRECGFDIADPLAIESFRDAAEEYLMKLASYVRASMLSSRRVQPIPQDFEFALKRHSLPVDSLLPYLQAPPKIEPIPTQLPSPPPEEDDDFKVLPSLEPQLSGEDDRVRSPYIPKHFPEFPSKHTYRHTPVFTERERDPRKIRERAADDGRLGEEALRKLARAAFKDHQPSTGGRDKKQWGRKAESFDSMFEKTVKALSKKASRNTAPGTSSAMDIDSGAAEIETKPSKSKGLAGMELPPIINCERDLWRRNANSGRQRSGETSGTKHTPDLSRVESWIFMSPSRSRLASSFACRMGSHEVVSTVKPPAHLSQYHSPWLGDSLLWRVAGILNHLEEFAFLELYCAALPTLFFLEVFGHDVDMVWEGFGGEEGNERCHWSKFAFSFGEKLLLEVHEEGLDELLHDLRVVYTGSFESGRSHFGVAPIDQLLELFLPSAQPVSNQPLPEQDKVGDLGDPTSPTANHEPPHFVQPHSTSRVYPSLEVSSTASGAGKSQILYYLTALAVLPSELNGISVGGFGSAVVFIDTDGRFDAERLYTVARGIVQDKVQTGGGPDSVGSLDNSIAGLLLTCLQHVHVFRPQSSLALLAALQSLDAYLLDLTRHISANRPVHTIFIDSATAFLWQDKLQEEISRTEDIGRPAAEIERERLQKRSFYLADIYAELVATLKHIQHVFDCTVVYTTTSFHGKPMSKPSAPYGSYSPFDTAFPKTSSFRSPLPPPWGLFPTLRLVLQREAVRPFPPSVTVPEAQKEASMRQENVMRGEFDWPRRILDELKSRDGGQFVFRVGREGVTFN